MAAHRFAFTAAVGALAFAVPALAEPAEPYEYAHEADGAEVVYEVGPVVQPLPAPPLPAPPPLPGRPPAAAMPHGHPAMGPHHPGHAPAYGHYGHAMPPMAHPRVPPFDRDAWLRNCRERIRGVSREERGSVIGGLLGATAGGVIGNRAFDSERLGGTLLGAGIGGLAGIAIGAAIGAANDRRREDECAWHLDRYMAGGPAGYGYGYPQAGYGYGYGYPAVAYVPVLVAVPQRAVVRETVTEEWVDVPTRSRSVPRRAPAHHPAPAPDKRVKLIKAR